MLTIFCALYGEAKEIIRSFQLKKETGRTHFQVFTEEQAAIRLVITGTGPVAAASAVAEISALYPPKETDFFLNFGVCGSEKSIAPGKIYLCHKLTEACSGRTFYPDMLYSHPFEEAELISVPAVLSSRELEQYILEKSGEEEWIDSAPRLFDMEAAAIYQAGNYSYGPQQMFFLKVVSDHGMKSGEAEISLCEVLQETEAKVCAYVRFLGTISEEQEQSLAQRDESRKLVEEEAEKLGEELKGSEVMRQQLIQLLWYWKLTGVDYEGLIADLRRQGRLPVKDKREGKRILEELKGQVV